MLYQIVNGRVMFGADTILEHIDFAVKNKNDKIAVIGRNGAGKTTLLRVITKEVELAKVDGEDSTIVCPDGTTIGYLKQITFDDLEITLDEEIRKVFAKILSMKARLDELGIPKKDSSGDELYLKNVDKLIEIKKETVLRSYGKDQGNVPRWAQCLYAKPGLSDEERQLINEGLSNPEAKGKLFDYVLNEFASIDVDKVFGKDSIEEYIESVSEDSYIRGLAWDRDFLYVDMKKAIDSGEYQPDPEVLKQAKAFIDIINTKAALISAEINQYVKPEAMVFDLSKTDSQTILTLMSTLRGEDNRATADYLAQEFTSLAAPISSMDEIKKAKFTFDLTNEFAKNAHEHWNKFIENCETLKTLALDSAEAQKIMEDNVNECAECMYYNNAKKHAAEFDEASAKRFLDNATKEKKLPALKTAIATKIRTMSINEFKKTIESVEYAEEVGLDIKDILGKNLKEKALEKEVQKDVQQKAPEKEAMQGKAL